MDYHSTGRKNAAPFRGKTTENVSLSKGKISDFERFSRFSRGLGLAGAVSAPVFYAQPNGNDAFPTKK